MAKLLGRIALGLIAAAAIFALLEVGTQGVIDQIMAGIGS